MAHASGPDNKARRSKGSKVAPKPDAARPPATLLCGRVSLDTLIPGKARALITDPYGNVLRKAEIGAASATLLPGTAGLEADPPKAKAGGKMIVISLHAADGSVHREVACESDKDGVYLTASGRIITIDIIEP